MPKKNVSARVPPELADGLDEFADRENMNRTDAMTELLRFALEHHPQNQAADAPGESVDPEHVYTVVLEPENAEHLEESDVTPSEGINNLLNVYS